MLSTLLRETFSPVSLNQRLNHPRILPWFGLSIVISLYFGGISAYYALTQPYIIQDDARQHVIWLQRYVDPQLFPNDLIANYFQNADPAGYKFCYWAMAKLGVEPIVLAKILPLILGTIATVYLFKFTLQIVPIPFGAFLATLLLNQNFWLKDNLISATPRAFLYPLFAAFLYYLLKRSLVPCLVSIALQGLFFPQLVLVEVAILTIRLFRWSNRPSFSKTKSDYIFWVAGLLVALTVMLPFALDISEFGTLVTADQMRAMPEFGRDGRSQYFGVDPVRFILGGASGIRVPIIPFVILLSFGLPFLLKSRSSIAKVIKANILLQIVLASLGMFFLAHLFLLKLYFPSRYTYHSLRFVMPIAAGIVLLILLESAWRGWQQKQQVKARFSVRESLLIGLASVFIFVSIALPFVPWVFLQFQNWIVGEIPAVYQFLATQPKDTLIASLAKEANNLPAFAQRSVLVSEEFMFAYHPAYYNQLQQRSIDTLHAQYDTDLASVKRVIEQYGIDFFLIDQSAFEPDYLLEKDWLIHSSFRAVVLKTIDQLRQGEKSAMAQLIDRCSAVSTEDLILLDATCIRSSQTQ